MFHIRSPFVRVSLAFVVVGLMFCAVGFPLSARARDNARRSSCQSNLKQIMLGLAQYRQDSDGYFPRVAWNPAPEKPRKDCNDGPPFGWNDGIQPYLKSTCILQCPSNIEPPSRDMFPEHAGYTDYWINARLSAQKSASAQTIALGDDDGRGTSRASKSAFPSNWKSAPEDAWFLRHRGGANYAFADGHVKWLAPENVGAQGASFAP